MKQIALEHLKLSQEEMSQGIEKLSAYVTLLKNQDQKDALNEELKRLIQDERNLWSVIDRITDLLK